MPSRLTKACTGGARRQPHNDGQHRLRPVMRNVRHRRSHISSLHLHLG